MFSIPYIHRAFVTLSALFIISTVVFAQKTVNNGSYHLINKIEIGGEGGWDYIFDDSDAHRLYVSHATKVVVIDTDTDKVVGEIPNLKGIHGIATAADFGRGFISDGRDNSVVIFDTKTLKTLATVKVGTNPDTIIYDPSTKRIFSFNGGSKDATAVDAATSKIVGTLALEGRPEFAISDENGTIFVNIEDKNEIVAFDPKKLEVKSRWSIAPECSGPSGMALDRKRGRIFSVCSNKTMVVLDSRTGKILTTLPIGSGVDAAGYDEKEKLAFASNGEGTLTLVREDANDKFSVSENVTTQRGARTMTLDRRTHKIYLPTAQFGETPAPTADRPRPRPPMIPNTFVILVFGQK